MNGASVLATILCCLSGYNFLKIAWYIPLIRTPSYGLETGMPLHLLGMRSDKLISDPQLFLTPHTFMGCVLLLLMAARLYSEKESTALNVIYFTLAVTFVLHVIPEHKGLPNRQAKICINETCVMAILIGVGVAFYNSEIGWWITGIVICLAPIAEVLLIIGRALQCLVTGQWPAPEGDEPMKMNSGYARLRHSCCPCISALDHAEKPFAEVALPWWSSYIRIFKVLDPTIVEIFPEDYLGASNEMLLLTLALAWILVASFNPEELEANALRDVFGFNPAMTAFSRKPALYLCPLGFVATIYLQKRYGSTDVLRASLMGNSPMQKKYIRTVEIVRSVSISVMCLVFVITPEVDPYWHCAIVLNYMFWRYTGLVAKHASAEVRHHRKGSWTYLVVHGIVVLTLLILTCFQLGVYDKEKHERGPVPWILFVIFEWAWLICLFLSARFMPARPSIRVQSGLCNDKDFDSDELIDISSRRVNKDCLSHYFRIWKLFDAEPHMIDPEDYTGAGGEGLVFVLILSWILGVAFNMENINENPLKDRFGYDNVCVAWDEPPALYPAAVLFNIPIYLQIRYAFLDNLRAKLSKASARQVLITSLANLYMLVSFACVSLIFVITPNVEPTLHTAFFLNLIVARYVGAASDFYEVENRYHKRGSWVYMGFYGMLSLMAVAGGVSMLALYKEEGKERGPVPVWLAITLDYAWFICICFTSMYLPAAPSLYFKYKLLNNDIYHDVGIGKDPPTAWVRTITVNSMGSKATRSDALKEPGAQSAAVEPPHAHVLGKLVPA